MGEGGDDTREPMVVVLKSLGSQGTLRERGQHPEALCGWRRSQHKPGNSTEIDNPEPWSRREEAN